MKILIINSLYYPNILGGAERSVQHLAEALNSAGHEVVVVCLGTEASIKEVNGVRVYYVPLFNVYFPFVNRPPWPARLLWNLLDIYNPVMARRVSKIIDLEKPDVVHTNVLLGFSYAVWWVIHKRGIRLVHTIRDHLLFCPRSTMFRNGTNCKTQCVSCRLFSSPKKMLCSYVDQVVGISNYILDRHLSEGWFKNTNRNVIFNSFRRCDGKINSIAPDRVRFGYIGRVSPAKGIELLLRAFLSLENGAESELLVAGEGEDKYFEKVRNMARGTNVRFLGFVPRGEFYKQVDVVVVPSLVNEALGRAILEAYACGVPVLASRRGGIPEIVDHGQTGFLFDPDRQGELQKYMELVLRDPSVLQKLSTSCISKSKEFREEIIARKYIEVYEGKVHPICSHHT